MTPRKKLLALFIIPPLMFGFGYAMVPIYDVFCDLTGLNGKTGAVEIVVAQRMQVDESRLIKVEFLAKRNQELALKFAPAVPSMMVHPGRTYHTTYKARNLRAAALVAQAVPSVAPGKAATYFNKVECFCFAKQAFAAGEARDMPVIFVIHPSLPAEVDTISLSYTFFDIQTDPQPDDDHASHDHEHSG